LWAEDDTSTQSASPLFQVEISADTQGIAQAISDTNNKLQAIQDALEDIAANKELSAEQTKLITSTTSNINQLVTSSTNIVNRLPMAVSEAREEVRTSGKVFVDELKADILMILGLVAIVLVIVLFAFYWFVIRPLHTTIIGATTNVALMTKSIHSTAKSLDESSKTHLEIMKRLEVKRESA
jgi:uncharacterized protein YqhQ